MNDKKSWFREETLEHINQLSIGDILHGTVVQIGPEHVYIDINYKSDGLIPIEEFDTVPKIGDHVDVMVVKKESAQGFPIVSKRKADENIIYERLRNAYANHEPIEGTVIRTINGGFEIILPGKIRAFNPQSKIDITPGIKAEDYINMHTQFYIKRLYNNNRLDIVLSRREYLQESIRQKRAAFFDHTKIGDIVEGTVKSFTSFGAFIDLGGFEGLLHLNDMSWGHASRPRDYAKRGERMSLRVIRLEPEKNNIGLSLRHLSEDPWVNFEQRHHVDEVLTGRVTKLANFGAFVEIEPGVEGLIHISELSWVRHVRHPREILHVGEGVQVMILGYDIENMRISLGFKQTQTNPWDTMDEKFPVGNRITGQVRRITDHGIVMDLADSVEGFIYTEDLTWMRQAYKAKAKLKVGQEIEVLVLSVEPERRRVRVGLKQLEGNPWERLGLAYKNHSPVEGHISNITDFGVFVRLDGGVEGLIDKRNLADPRMESFENKIQQLAVGDTIRSMIIEFKPARQRLGLSVRELARVEEQKDIRNYMKLEDDSLTIGEFLKRKQGT